MFIFEKGNPDNLQGRGLIYTHNTSGDEHFILNPFSVGLFIGVTPPDLIDVMKSYDSEIIDNEMKETISKQYERMVKRYFEKHREEEEDVGKAEYSIDIMKRKITDPEQQKEFEEKMQKYMKSRKKDLKRPFLGCGISHPEFCDNHYDLSKISGDVIRAADAPTFGYAQSMLTDISKLYFDVYNVQQDKRISDSLEPYISSLRNISEMTKDEFQSEFCRLAQNFMYSVETKNYSDFGRQAADLRQLTKGSPLVSDVVNFCEIVRSDSPQKIVLMTLYLEKMLAIVDEKFEEASMKKNEIEMLRGSKQA